MRAPCPPGISAASSPADRPPSARKKKGSPKGDHVTPASAAVSPFPSPSSLPPGPSPRRQQLRRPAGQPAGPCLLVWPPSTPPAALWQLAHAQIAFYHVIFFADHRRSVVAGAGAPIHHAAAANKLRRRGLGLGTAIRANSG